MINNMIKGVKALKSNCDSLFSKLISNFDFFRWYRFVNENEYEVDKTMEERKKVKRLFISRFAFLTNAIR